MLPILFAALLAVLGAVHPPQARAADAPLDFIRVIQDAKAELFPKTVYIKVVGETFAEGKKQRRQWSGSGVIVSTDGFVVTNHHVVEKAVSVRCILATPEQMQADVVGSDKETDLALLKLQVPAGHAPMPAARLGESSRLASGDFVMAMGSPFGLSRSVSFGIVSNPEQYLEDSSEYNNWIQTDASINPGNSGGPLVDVRGEVVGINTLGSGGLSIGFAIPSVLVKSVIAEIQAKGKVERSWSGIQFQALRDFERNTFVAGSEGVLVGGMDPDSPAEEGGLRVGDLILSLGGQPVRGLHVEDLPEVRRRFASLPAGSTAQLGLLRDGEALTKRLVPRHKGSVQGEDFDCEEWMLTVKEINQFEHPWFHHYRKKGTFIFAVKKDANADRSGLEGGDILVRVDGREIGGLDTARKAYAALLKKAPGRRKALFEVIRRGFPMKVILDYNRTKASYEEEK